MQMQMNWCKPQSPSYAYAILEVQKFVKQNSVVRFKKFPQKALYGAMVRCLTFLGSLISFRFGERTIESVKRLHRPLPQLSSLAEEISLQQHASL